MMAIERFGKKKPIFKPALTHKILRIRDTVEYMIYLF